MTELPPDQQQLGIRLARIFLPYSSARIERLYPTLDGTARFAHYTSADSALKIIESKRMWMRNAMCMVDYSEIRHGVAILRKLFAPDARRTEFVQALDACVPGVAEQMLQAFDKSWDNVRRNTYIASVSEHHKADDPHGRLSMWRAFGAGVRVAVVINVPYFSGAAPALSVIFSPVAYMSEEQVGHELTEVIERVRREAEFLRSVDTNLVRSTVYLMLLAAAICLKHEGFREEVEWRAFYTPLPGIKPEIQMTRSLQSVGGVPQQVYEFPLDADAAADTRLAGLDFAQVFDSLIIGPTPYSASVREAFIEALGKAGVKDARDKVFASEIPIRT